MHIGATFPNQQLGAGPGAIRDFLQALEGMGYEHLAFADHIVGVDVTNRPDWDMPYTNKTVFHEPMAFSGFVAACAPGLGIITSIIILPQRQTVLVAKQAAEIDLLTGGKLRLGVAVGRYQIEYEVQGEEFHNRGHRIEEQMALLRALWTNEVVDFRGRWHRVDEAGINPMPVQRPIPLWMGGGRDDRALRRIARLADGWLPPSGSTTMVDNVERLRGYLAEAGRDPAAFGIEARIDIGKDRTPGQWRQDFETWRDLGATHMTPTEGGGFSSIAERLESLRRFMEVVR